MPSEEEVVTVLKEIIDPHTNISVYDMGLISDLKVTKDRVGLTFKPTSPFCPLGVHLAQNIKRRVLDVKGVKKVDLKIVGHMQEDAINRALAEMN